MSRICAAPFCSFKHLSIVFSEVIDIFSSDRWQVIQPMHQIRSPEGVGFGIRDSVSKHAHIRERSSSFVTEIADDCFAGSILTTPVASPAWMKKSVARLKHQAREHAENEKILSEGRSRGILAQVVISLKLQSFDIAVL
jgi:hypothetical protein